MQRWVVVGAGYAGLAAAHALNEAGLDVELLDRGAGPGGVWADGAYDSVRLITTRRRTAYPDLPMPGDGAAFPDRAEMRDYLAGASRTWGLDARTRSGVEVRGLRRLARGWSLDTTDGARRVDGVVLATGAFSRPLVPRLPGRFDGVALHSRDYRRVEDLPPGPVLVVGLGNSAADIAVEAARAGHEVLLAVRTGRHLLPRTVLGRPTSELAPPPVPDALVELGLGLTRRVVAPLLPRGEDRGLPAPDHGLLERAPVLHDALLPAIAAGDVRVRPAVASLLPHGVRFADGTQADVASIVWATGYEPGVPLLPAGTRLVAGVLAADVPGLAVVGQRMVRSGAGRYLASCGRLVATAALAQPLVTQPVGRVLLPLDGGSAELVDERRELALHRRLGAALVALARAAVAA